MTERTGLRWGKAVLHGVLAIVLVAVVTAALAATFDVADPRRFGEGVGRFSLFVGLGAMGASWLAQTGRRVAAWVVGGLLAVLMIGLVVMVAVVGNRAKSSAPAPLPTADLVRADQVLRHPILGFSVPDPGPTLTPQPELAAAQFPTGPDMRAWVYADLSSTEVVIVLLASDAATDARTFESFFAGVVDGQTRTANDAGVIVDERERSVSWETRRAHAYVVIEGAIHTRLDAFGLPGGEAVIVIGAAGEAERFAELADGVVVPGIP